MPVWWPRIIIRPRVKLARPRFKMPSRPPDLVIFGVIFVIILFVLGGNIYTLVRTPPAIAGSSSGTPILVAPGLDAQLGMEGVVASVVIFVGVIGLGLIYYGSKYVFQPGYATRLIILGIILSGVAFLIFSYLWSVKVGAI
jgi:hypothetical protein